MKVLFFGHYKEGTGWAQASIDYILAMDSVGIDVACRNINLTGYEHEVPDRILELEKKSTEGCDFCIQHLLPHHLVGSKSFKKNIAILDAETTNIKNQPWFVHLQQMDEIWVPNVDSWSSLAKENLLVENGIKVIHHTCDISKYVASSSQGGGEYAGGQHISIPEIDNMFKFYYVGDLNERKNLASILKCFHSEFDSSEPAALIIKVKKFGQPPQQTRNEVEALSRVIKQRLRIYSDESLYRPEVIISDDAPEEVIKSIHRYADCFVCPTHGEAWSIPSFDAMAFGNTPICSDFGGPKEFIDKLDPATGTLVGGQMSVCDCPDAAFPEILTGREYWFQPNERDVKEAMRYYYENRHSIDRRKGLEKAKMFSYEVVGNKIKENLNG